MRYGKDIIGGSENELVAHWVGFRSKYEDDTRLVAGDGGVSSAPDFSMALAMVFEILWYFVDDS